LLDFWANIVPNQKIGWDTGTISFNRFLSIVKFS
jgi:hypothetical protein